MLGREAGGICSIGVSKVEEMRAGLLSGLGPWVLTVTQEGAPILALRRNTHGIPWCEERHTVLFETSACG